MVCWFCAARSAAGFGGRRDMAVLWVDQLCRRCCARLGIWRRGLQFAGSRRSIHLAQPWVADKVRDSVTDNEDGLPLPPQCG